MILRFFTQTFYNTLLQCTFEHKKVLNKNPAAE